MVALDQVELLIEKSGRISNLDGVRRDDHVVEKIKVVGHVLVLDINASIIENSIVEVVNISLLLVLNVKVIVIDSFIVAVTKDVLEVVVRVNRKAEAAF